MAQAQRDLERDPDRGPTRARALDWALAAGLGVTAFVVRALTWPTTFRVGDDGAHLVGADAYYHMRRIQWSVEHFPDVLTRDPYLRFPDGGEPIWSPAFDLGIAALARVLAGSGNPTGVETVAVWIPPIVGALTVVLVFETARRFFGRRAAILAGAALCVLRAHVWYSQIGFVDHHVAVALMAALLVAATMHVVRGTLPGRTMRSAWGPGVGLGLSMGCALLIWPGSLIHVALGQACVLAWVITSIGATESSRPADPTESRVGARNEAGRRASVAAVIHGSAFLLVTPFAIGRSWEVWGDLSPVVLSSFQPLWLGLPVVGFGLCAMAWQSDGLGGSPGRRAAGLAIGLGLPAAAALVAPGVRDGLGAAFGWFFRAETFQAVVAESLPLFSDGRGFTARRAHAQLSLLVWALPAAVAFVGLPRGRTSSHRVIAFWCAALFAATLVQYRFANSLSVLWALTFGCSLDLAWRALAGRSLAIRRGFVGATALLLAVVLAPIAAPHRIAMGTAVRALSGEAVRPPERFADHSALKDAARWLGEHSPPTAGWLDAPSSRSGTPSYGVLAAWGDGHVTRYLAKRPMVQDNFGDDIGRERFDQAEAYYAARSEQAALRTAAELRARYVLVRTSGSGHPSAPYGPRSMLARLFKLRGSAGRTPGGTAVALPALTRHRLLYESPEVAGRDSRRYKIFEIVTGGIVVGRAAPRALVEARLTLADESQSSELAYVAWARADSQGRYELRLPYPTEPFEGRFAATGPYRISSGERVGALSIDEASVIRGKRKEGPSLAP